MAAGRRHRAAVSAPASRRQRSTGRRVAAGACAVSHRGILPGIPEVSHMADTPKTRGQMAIKSKRLDADWQLLVKKAAERAGMGIGDFIVEAARARALAVLKNEPE